MFRLVDEAKDKLSQSFRGPSTRSLSFPSSTIASVHRPHRHHIRYWENGFPLSVGRKNVKVSFDTRRSAYGGSILGTARQDSRVHVNRDEEGDLYPIGGAARSHVRAPTFVWGFDYIIFQCWDIAIVATYIGTSSFESSWRSSNPPVGGCSGKAAVVAVFPYRIQTRRSIVNW